MAKIPYEENSIDELAYEKAAKALITKDTSIRKSVILDELRENDIDEEEKLRELREFRERSFYVNYVH